MRRALTIAIAAATVACAGGEGPEPPGNRPEAAGPRAAPPGPRGPRLTRAQFVRRANAICARGKAEGRRAVKRRLPSTDPDELRRNPPSTDVRVDALTERAIVALSYQQRLRALRPPARTEDAWKRFLDRSERAVVKLPEVASAVAQEDPAALNAVFADYLELASANQDFVDSYGLERCAPESEDVPELDGLRISPR